MDADIRDQLAALRRTKSKGFRFMVLGIGAGVLVFVCPAERLFPAIHPADRITCAVILIFFSAIMGQFFQRSLFQHLCPKCGQPFFVRDDYYNSLTSKCLHCNVSLIEQERDIY